jgi:hypothetical protein
MKNDEVVNVTKEKILTAYEVANEESKELLKNLFPKVFEDDKYFDLFKLWSDIKSGVGHSYIFTDASAIEAGFNGAFLMEIRYNGNYAGKAFYLANSYNWEIRLDDMEKLCLIPTKK